MIGLVKFEVDQALSVLFSKSPVSKSVALEVILHLTKPVLEPHPWFSFYVNGSCSLLIAFKFVSFRI